VRRRLSVVIFSSCSRDRERVASFLFSASRHRALPTCGLPEHIAGRGWTCALFLSSSVSGDGHAADVSRPVLAIRPEGGVYCAHFAALPIRGFDLATTISVIDLKLR
jgi:hypothetical protein